ncbi:hypothetical protein PF002_g19176 [Phytophthora fragariae]|uniref:RxLR effector protein n=1 Tax=Phytophthora fragariae TaxID=53985 RepID=A0A6A3XVV3_9STRA|nr:hypothetical protein PF002_g19176 [Phytophthora fragariae]KAE9216459.1 hypothetical protein PF004_g14447 [Phytophthora fragariae]
MFKTAVAVALVLVSVSNLQCRAKVASSRGAGSSKKTNKLYLFPTRAAGTRNVTGL